MLQFVLSGMNIVLLLSAKLNVKYCTTVLVYNIYCTSVVVYQCIMYVLTCPVAPLTICF